MVFLDILISLVTHPVFIGIVLVIIVVCIVFRRYWSALVSDYVFDAGFSALDYFLIPFGIGAVADVGDFVGSIIIYHREKKVSGKLAAQITSLEAANFLIFGINLVPLTEPIEWILSAFPATLVVRLWLNKYRKAEKKEKILKKEFALLKEKGGSIPDVVTEQLEQVKKLIHEENPVGALDLEKEIEKEVKPAFEAFIQRLRDEIDGMSKQMWQYDQQAPKEVLVVLQQFILAVSELEQKGDQLFKQEEYGEALDMYMKAEQDLTENFQDLQEQYEAWQAEQDEINQEENGGDEQASEQEDEYQRAA